MGASEHHSRESPTVTTFHFLVLSWDWSAITPGGSPNTAFCFAATRTLSLFCSCRSLGGEEFTTSQPLPVQEPLFTTLWEYFLPSSLMELKVLPVLLAGSFSTPFMLCHLLSSSYSFCTLADSALAGTHLPALLAPVQWEALGGPILPQA